LGCSVKAREYPPRLSLGSSQRMPELTGPEYYTLRRTDASHEIPKAQTWQNLRKQYRVTRSQLQCFEAHYTMETHGPRYTAPKPSQPLENLVAFEESALVPEKYLKRLPAEWKQRLAYFVKEDMAKTNLDASAQKTLVQEIMASKWYKDARWDKDAEGKRVSDLQFYAFFDDIMLETLSKGAVDRKKVGELWEKIHSPGWRKVSTEKPMLTLDLYKKLSESGYNDQAIAANYRTEKPNSIRAYKAW
jgi:hypothetical protein